MLLLQTRSMWHRMRVSLIQVEPEASEPAPTPPHVDQVIRSMRVGTWPEGSILTEGERNKVAKTLGFVAPSTWMSHV